MDNITKELEQQIIDLVKQNRLLEAVALVHKELQLGLKQSKELVDKYKQMMKA